jgi:hypothetical protein
MNAESETLILKSVDETKTAVNNLIEKFHDLAILLTQEGAKTNALEKETIDLKKRVHKLGGLCVTEEHIAALTCALEARVLTIEESLSKVNSWVDEEVKKSIIKGFFVSFSLGIKKHVVSILLILSILGIGGAYIADSPLHKAAISRVSKV